MLCRRFLLFASAAVRPFGSLLPALSLAATPALVWAAPNAQPTDIRIDAGSLEAALFALAEQTGVQIVFTHALVSDRRVSALHGRMTAETAVNRLIDGSGLQAQRAADRVIVLRPTGGIFRTIASGNQTAAASEFASETPAAMFEPPVQVEEVIIGSHLRGVRDSASPVLVMTREEMEQAGRASVADALGALPQAFGGTASEDATATGTDSSGNTTRATAINLRGLGPDATLVLVNGRRLAGTGLRGDFVDVSSIPMSAVERIEVLLDGASALYGSDAVGGVINIVLRRSFDGAETRLLAGGATQGGAGQVQIAQTFGADWKSGHIVGSVQHTNRDRLRAKDRAFARDADLRSLGGSDYRSYFSAPGNLMRTDATGTLVPAYAIPAGQSGLGLSPSALTPGVNLENQRAGYNLMPRQRQDALYLAGSQNLTPAIDLSAEARLSRRVYTNVGGAATSLLTVTRANPYFVSPTGAASERIAYSFIDEIGGNRPVGTVDTGAVSIGGVARLPRGWSLDAYGAYALEFSEDMTDRVLNTAFLAEALGNAPDNGLTAYSAARDGYFNPFDGQGANNRTVIDFIGSGWVRSTQRSEVRSLNVKLDGALFTLPGGPLGLAVGAQIRREGFKTGGSTLDGFAPRGFARTDDARTINALFAELRAPLFSASNARPGLQRLELSAAVRREDYRGSVSSTDPKLGLIWAPTRALTIKTSVGTSFRAPALSELHERATLAPTILPNGSAQVITMMLLGGNPDLKPETARSKAVTFEFAPPSTPRLTLSATAFETRFKDRIGRPGLENINFVLSSPELAPFRTFIAPQSNPADLATIQALINAPGSIAQGVTPPETYRAIVDARHVNTGELLTRGVDASASLRATLANDPLVLRADVTWISDYKRKVTPASIPADLAGVAGYPADLRLRAAIAWTHQDVTASLAANHTSASHAPTGARIDRWTSFDLNLQLTPRTTALRDTVIRLSVQNLLDSDPPFYDNPAAVGYDTANADPIGRVVSLQLTRRW